MCVCACDCVSMDMGWLMLVESIKLYLSFAKEPHNRDAILQKRPIILSILLIVATPYQHMHQLREGFGSDL